MPCGFISGGQVRVYHADRLGSVLYVKGSTNPTDNILVSYAYEGFGKIVGQNGGGGGPYQFCGLWGYRNDWDAGLLHVGARYYEPETGRFVQKDPMLAVNHPYLYVENNSLNFVDPDGRKRQPPVGRYIAYLISAFLAARKLVEHWRKERKKARENPDQALPKWIIVRPDQSHPMDRNWPSGPVLPGIERPKEIGNFDSPADDWVWFTPPRPREQ